jgi:carboxyl-terminal processing protease
MPPRNMVFIMVTAMISFACYLKAERNRYASQLAEAIDVVSKLYVEDVKPRNLFENAMSGMLEGLDQYSSYIGPEVFQQMEQSLDQEFGGVGIEVEKESDEQPIVVLSPMFDSPGFHAGLRSGDAILAINGEKTVGMKQKDAVTKMRGRPGTIVKLLVKHLNSDQEVEIEVERKVIMVDSLLGDLRRPDGTWDFRLQENPRIGFLRLTTFGKHSVEELQKALGDGKGCPYDAIILDLRNNAGGLLDAAVDTCRLLIDKGRIVSTRGRDGRERSSYDANGTAVIPASIPMVVLVNKYSASASEIVAACLQDHGRAIVVGERSWGKGTVQNLFPLEGGHSALKLTTASYWRPSGKNIHRLKDAPPSDGWGVSPTAGFEVTLTDEELERVVRMRRDRDLGNSVKSIVAGALKSNGKKVEPPIVEPAKDTVPPSPPAPTTEATDAKPSESAPPGPTTEATDAKPSESSPPVPFTEATDAKSSESAPASTAVLQDDPQLRKAIENLEQRLSEHSSDKA